MPSIRLTNNKSLYDVIARSMAIYVRPAGTNYKFESLGYTDDETIISAKPMMQAIDRSADYTHSYKATLSTRLVQSSDSILTKISDYGKTFLLEVALIDEPVSSYNIIMRNVMLHLDGEVPLSGSKVRSLPVKFTGFFSDIRSILLPTLKTYTVPETEYVDNDAAPLSYAALTSSNLTTSGGVEFIDASKGEACSYYFYPQGTQYSPSGLNNYNTALDLKAKFKIAATTGREIGFILYNNEGSSSERSVYSFLVHNHRVNIYRTLTQSGTRTFKGALNLRKQLLNTEYQVELKVRDNEIKIYQDGIYLGKYTLDHFSTEGFYWGVQVVNKNGTGSEVHCMYDITITGDGYNL